MEGEVTERKLTIMKILIPILFLCCTASGQSNGYVLRMANNAVDIGAAVGASVGVTGSIGYTTGAGSTVTQNANKTNGVTINKICGQITMNNAALAAAAEVSFTVTNSLVSATDVVIVNIQSVGTAGSYFVSVGAVANGSFSVTVGNVSAGSLSQALVLNFAIIKSVNN